MWIDTGIFWKTRMIKEQFFADWACYIQGTREQDDRPKGMLLRVL